MGDLKRKIIDILFEDEPPVIDEAPLSDVMNTKKEVKNMSVENKEKSKERTVKVPDAKEILYGKKEKQSSFIDYFETGDDSSTNKSVAKETKNEEKYELRENVSPIFGLINQKERKKKSASNKDIQKAVVNNPPNEYVSIVISPIYGYDADKANDARKALEDKGSKKDSSEIKEDMASIFDDNAPFDMPIDDTEVKEIAREAIFESVVELHKNTDNFEEEVQEEIEEFKQDINQDELPLEEMYTTEITKDEIKEAFDAVTRNEFKENKNESLFDLDDYIKDDSKDDLFNELGGDKR